MEVGLHQGSVLSPFLFAVAMDRMTDEARQESPWTLMLAEDIVRLYCSKDAQDGATEQEAKTICR